MGDKAEVKSFQIVEDQKAPEKKEEQKPAQGAAKPDDVRAGLAASAPLLATLLSGKKITDKSDAEAKKPDAATASDKKAEDSKLSQGGSTSGQAAADAKATENKKPKSPEKPTADKMAKRILGVEPSETKEDGGSGKGESDGDKEPEKSEPIGKKEIVEIAATSAATAAAEVVKKVLPKPQEKPAEDYPESYKDSAPILDRMSEMFPKKYGNIKKQIREFAQKENEYRDMWLAKNEGQEFDPEAEEHQKFYAEASPDIDSDDIETAEQAINAEKIEQSVKRQVDERLAPVLRDQAYNAIKPAVAQNAALIAAATIKSILPDVDVESLTPESLQKIQEDHPREIEIINSVASRAVPVLESYLKIVNRIEGVDPRNPVHNEVIGLVSRVQDFIAGRPKSEQIRTGSDGIRRSFKRVEEFVALPQSEQSKYWTVGAPEVVAQLEIEAQHEAGNLWSREKAVLQKYGVKFEDRSGEKEKEVMGASQNGQAKKISSTQEQPKISVSQSGSERGGVGAPSGATPISSSSMFGKLMSSLRPTKVR